MNTVPNDMPDPGYSHARREALDFLWRATLLYLEPLEFDPKAYGDESADIIRHLCLLGVTRDELRMFFGPAIDFVLDAS